MKPFLPLIMLLTATTAVGQENKLYEIKVHDFTHLEVDNNIRVRYIANADSAGLIIFSATPEMASRLYFTDKGKGKVDIQCCADCTYDMEFPEVTIYSSGLRKIVNSGDSLVTVERNPPCDRFDATLLGNGRISVRDIEASKVDAKIATGNGQLIISGKCTTCNLMVTGTGTIQADRLKAVQGKATVIGTGTIGCDFSEVITIAGVGTGKVMYRVTPKKVKSHAIGIKHYPLDSKED